MDIASFAGMVLMLVGMGDSILLPMGMGTPAVTLKIIMVAEVILMLVSPTRDLELPTDLGKLRTLLASHLLSLGWAFALFNCSITECLSHVLVDCSGVALGGAVF